MAPLLQTGWATLKSLLWNTWPEKKVCLQPDIAEYSPEDQAPMYDLMIGKQTLQDLGVKLDFQEKRITIDKILLTIVEKACVLALSNDIRLLDK
jgi:hypothetical protein